MATDTGPLCATFSRSVVPTPRPTNHCLKARRAQFQFTLSELWSLSGSTGNISKVQRSLRSHPCVSGSLDMLPIVRKSVSNGPMPRILFQTSVIVRPNIKHRHESTHAHTSGHLSFYHDCKGKITTHKKTLSLLQNSPGKITIAEFCKGLMQLKGHARALDMVAAWQESLQNGRPH